MTTIAQYYAKGNSLWPDPLPELTFPEAVRAARKLYRYVLGRKCPWVFKQVHGRLNTWVYSGCLNINLAGDWQHKGWADLVHSLAHLCHNRIPDHDKPHSKEHARLEIRMIKEVLKRGWLAGALKDKLTTAPADARVKELERIAAAKSRWERKMKRAQTALKKLTRRERYYQRALAA